MPRRDDLRTILILGSGPIVIGQAGEFDYSGTQGARALTAEGYRVVLVNSNPATIMTDPSVADRTYVEPLDAEAVEAVIAVERPDALLPTLGGQTALNLAMELSAAGVLDRHGVELIGADVDAIRLAEDREVFRDTMAAAGLAVPASRVVTDLAGGRAAAAELGLPVILRPGCVWGPRSELWVGRVGRWLRAHRLGDLGAAGDGWSNLVHVDDVCLAAIRALQLPLLQGEWRAFNLAAPDSPRWNEYFLDLALELGATPVRRLSARRLQLDAKVAGPFLQVSRKLLQKAGRTADWIPDPITPGLVDLWQRHLRLDPGAATRDLKLAWTPYPAALEEAAAWFNESCRSSGADPWRPPLAAR